jgi:acyl-CoA synthetase (AMP-forming)/AMP-acid ligase II
MPHPSITAGTHPDKPAIIMGSSGEIVTYRQLDERSNQAAQLFRSLGLRRGDHICIMMENNRQFLEIVWAAQRSGLVFTPINTHLSKDETVYILSNCRAKMFIGSWAFAEMGEQIVCEPCEVEHFYMVGGTRAGFKSWEDACESQPTEVIADQCNGVPMLYSSGTTGTPKGIFIERVEPDVNTPPALAAYMSSIFGFDDETIYLSPAPLFHAGPLHYSMMTTYQGGTIVVMEKFDAERALKLIERHRVTHSQWVPIMFVRMLKLPRVLRESYDTTSLKLAIHAAAPCPIEIKEQMINWWGEVLVEYYSATEGIGLTIIDSSEWLDHRGSVGRAVVGTVHIVDAEGNNPGPGKIGSVYFSGEQIRFSYHEEPEKTDEVYNQDGWATTNDIGYVDEEGFLYLTDRKGYTIVSGGKEVHPQEVENALVNHEKVADVAVYGIPNQELGEEVKAVVQPVDWKDASDATASEILEWLKSRIDDSKMPRSVEFHPNLPRVDNGKLYKQELAEARKKKTG